MILQLAMFELDDYVDVGESWTGPCAHCGVEKHATRDDPWGLDPCLVDYLPDVAHSCCGHGVQSKAYVISPGCAPSQSCEELSARIVLEGREALDYFRTLGVGPDCDGKGNSSSKDHWFGPAFRGPHAYPKRKGCPDSQPQLISR